MSAEHAPSASYMLHRATQVGTAFFDQSFGHREITPSQIVVLQAIADKPSASQTYIGALTSIDRSTIADIVHRVVRKGLVHRRRTRGDGRRYQLFLTASGEKVLAEAMPRARDVDAELLSSLTSAEAETFIRLLAKVARMSSSDDARALELEAAQENMAPHTDESRHDVYDQLNGDERRAN